MGSPRSRGRSRPSCRCRARRNASAAPPRTPHSPVTRCCRPVPPSRATGSRTSGGRRTQAPAAQEQRRPDRHRADVVGLQPPGHHRPPQQPGQPAECLVHRSSQYAAVREPRCALVLLGDGELASDDSPRPSRRHQPQPGRVRRSAGHAVLVVRREHGAGRGSFRVTLWWLQLALRGRRTGRRLDHERRPYLRPPTALMPGCSSWSTQLVTGNV